MQIGGIHHVTAVTANAPKNLEFYTGTLGMRLVKRTVNQDDVSAYHLFYGDEIGRAGTELTFFDWAHAAPARPGVGTVARTALRVQGRDTLDWWAERLREAGVAHGGVETLAGRATLRFADPEGQPLALVEDGGAPGGTPWARSPVPVERGIRGLGPITLCVRDLRPTEAILIGVLGFRRAGEFTEDGGRVAVWETGPGGAGAEVHVAELPELPPARPGRGGVHHVAFRTADQEEQQAWRERIARVGVPVTPLIDRFYFQSIYFREPNGILFEIATDGPGFATDEPAEQLGERLSLPPFLESERARIEAGLRPLGQPAGSSSSASASSR